MSSLFEELVDRKVLVLGSDSRHYHPVGDNRGFLIDLRSRELIFPGAGSVRNRNVDYARAMCAVAEQIPNMLYIKSRADADSDARSATLFPNGRSLQNTILKPTELISIALSYYMEVQNRREVSNESRECSLKLIGSLVAKVRTTFEKYLEAEPAIGIEVKAIADKLRQSGVGQATYSEISYGLVGPVPLVVQLNPSLDIFLPPRVTKIAGSSSFPTNAWDNPAVYALAADIYWEMKAKNNVVLSYGRPRRVGEGKTASDSQVGTSQLFHLVDGYVDVAKWRAALFTDGYAIKKFVVAMLDALETKVLSEISSGQRN